MGGDQLQHAPGDAAGLVGDGGAVLPLVEPGVHVRQLEALRHGIAVAQYAPKQPGDLCLNREALADYWLVNQVDALPDPEKARVLCELINRDASPCSLGR